MFPDPDEITAFSGFINFVSEPIRDGTSYVKVDDDTMRVTSESTMSPNLTVGDYVSGYKLDGDVLIINKHEASGDQTGPDPFLYAGFISKIAVNAFQIDDVIIDYVKQTIMTLVNNINQK